ncbi:MAG: FAD:protein FMN transferase [Clostridium sp.]|nr:FAD:protein FMN transferase [Clostridium sp.]
MFKLKKNIIPLMLILILTFTYAGCSKKQSSQTSVEPISKEGLLLGTFCKITIYDNSSRDVLEKAFNRISDIEDKMTINKETSEVININSKAGIDFVKVSDDTFDVIKKSLYYSQLSNGKFDISIGPIVKLWNIGTDKARVPSQQEINSKLPLVDYKNIILDEKNKRVMLKKKGMVIDLGAIAKGYAADQVEKVLLENGVKHAIINLGGNIMALGDKPDNTKWKLGIQDPASTRGEYLGIVEVENKSVVTSGVYERYFEQNGKRYHHILDTKTGYPVNNSLLGVSIVADKSVDADGLSTTVFSLGLDEGLKLIESLKNVDAVFITSDSNVYTSSGLKDNFKITNNKYKLKN